MWAILCRDSFPMARQLASRFMYDEPPRLRLHHWIQASSSWLHLHPLSKQVRCPLCSSEVKLYSLCSCLPSLFV